MNETEEIIQLKEQIAYLKTLVQIYTNKMEPPKEPLKDGDKMPLPLAMICQVLTDVIEAEPKAKNYLSWGWTNPETGKSYSMVVQRAEGLTPGEKAIQATQQERKRILKLRVLNGRPDSRWASERRKGWDAALRAYRKLIRETGGDDA
jgi:hypothetical protein